MSDTEWLIIKPYLPVRQARGRPWRQSRRELINARFDLIRTGWAWRLLPRAFPPWKTVFHYGRQWRLDGTWQQLHTALRERVRVRVGRQAQPSAGMLDRPSVKTTSVGGVRGDDGANKVSGPKRHGLVATQGLVLTARVHAADLQDRAAVPVLVEAIQAQSPRLVHVWVDQGYPGAGKAWITEQLGWSGPVVQHPPVAHHTGVPIGDLNDLRSLRLAWQKVPRTERGFRGVLPRRWVVERTCAWLGPNRRLSKEYERQCETSEALIYAAMSRLMLRRRARS